MEVPFLDLTAQYQSIRDEVDEAIASVIADTAFVRGRYVTEFERAFATANDAGHCVGVANGTDALFVALKTLGIGPGDEVITAANSWISSSEVISLAGAEPVFADVEPDYYTIDPAEIESRITDKTRALIPVHIYGQAADMDAIVEIAQEHHLAVVEDCAQAHFAEYHGRRVGLFGDVGAFSFYPGKNLGAYGDAGALITNDEELATRMRMFANHGADPRHKHLHEFEGVNSRLDGIQAAILSAKLPHIIDWNRRRQEHADLYSRLLAGVGDLVVPSIRLGSEHIFHIYCVRSAYRDRLRNHLKHWGVATGIHYPAALPFLDAYKRLGHVPEDFPISHALQGEILSLPMYPELDDEQISYVATAVKAFFDEC